MVVAVVVPNGGERRGVGVERDGCKGWALPKESPDKLCLEMLGLCCTSPIARKHQLATSAQAFDTGINRPNQVVLKKGVGLKVGDQLLAGLE